MGGDNYNESKCSGNSDIEICMNIMEVYLWIILLGWN